MAETYRPARYDVDPDTDSRAVTYGVGYEVEKLISKEMWRELVLDLLREQLGEATTVGTMNAAIAERLDTLAGYGIVPRSLPKRFERPQH